MSRPNRPVPIPILIGVVLLLLANMVMIFSFSSESREDSGDRSRAVTTAIARLLDPSFDDMTDEEQTEAVESIHGLVRKTAHFLEYALLGFLSTGLLLLLRRLGWAKIPCLYGWLIPAVFCLLYAAFDELHQLFVDRGAQVQDVILDFCGALFGIGSLHLLLLIVSARRARRCKGGEEDRP